MENSESRQDGSGLVNYGSSTESETAPSQESGPAHAPDSPDQTAQKGKIEDSILEGLEGAPPEVVKMFAAQISSRLYSGPPQNPLFEKINEQHIDKVIDNLEKESGRETEERKGVRMQNFFIFLIVIGFIIFLTVYLISTSNSALMCRVFEVAGSAGLGFAGGWGWASKKKD